MTYVDPATASYVVQIIDGLFLADGAAIGIHLYEIKRFLKGKKKDKQ